MCDFERIFDVPDPDPITRHQDPDDIEAVRIVGPSVTIDPNLGGLRQLLLFPPVNRLYRLTEPIPFPRLHLDERDRSLALDHEVDVAMAGPKTPLKHSPTRAPEPPLRDALAELSERLPGR